MPARDSLDSEGLPFFFRSILLPSFQEIFPCRAFETEIKAAVFPFSFCGRGLSGEFPPFFFDPAAVDELEVLFFSGSSSVRMIG